MHNDKSSKAKGVFRKIAMKDVKILCRYHFSKGVKPIDFQIDENANSLKHCVIGIGDTGIDITGNIVKNNGNYLSLMADIDHRNLNEADTEHKLYLMGDVEDNEMLTIDNRRTLSEFVKAHKRVYIVTKLDNELNLCGVVEKIVQHLKHINREVVVIAIKPFLFESPPWRVERVNDTLKRFEKYVHRLIVFDSQDLLKIKEAAILSIKECYRFMDKAIADIIKENRTEIDEVVSHINLMKTFDKQ